MDPRSGTRLSSPDASTATWRAWTVVRWAAGLGLLAGLAGTVLAACIVEGCTLPYETGETVVVPFELDRDHPVATSWIEVSLSADALPGDVEDRGARLQLTLPTSRDVTLTLVPEGTDEPVALISSEGIVSLPLDQCRVDEPCTVRALAIVEWTRPEDSTTLPVGLTVEALVRVPHTKDRCGLPGDVVTVIAAQPAPRPAVARGSVGEERHDSTELRHHVTVHFGAGVPSRPVEGGGSDDDPVVARGHIGLIPDADPPELGATATVVPGMWLRVTPDDGSVPVLDGAVPLGYPILPADATFAIDASCARPCERGYWIEAAIYDPAHGSWGVAETAVYGWTFDTSVSSSQGLDRPDASVTVTLDEADASAPPTPLAMRGTGEPFRVDSGHEATTLVIDATVPARPAAPFGDGIADVPITFRLTTVAVESGETGVHGDVILSNGHYLGDESTGDDDADTGGWGGPSTNSSPAGRPLAACAGKTDACAARTGLVLGRYDSVFDRGETPPFDVQWEWTVVGAPPGSSVTVRTVDGETIDVRDPSTLTAPIVLAVLLVSAGLAAFAIRSATQERRRASVSSTTPTEADSNET